MATPDLKYCLVKSVGKLELPINGIETGEGNLLFEGLIKDEHGNPPASGPGNRLMW